MKFTLSTNIKNVKLDDFSYIVTHNSKRVVNSLLANFKSGIRCFTLVGTYGTGKSSFLAAFEKDLLTNSNNLFEYNGEFNNYNKFKVLNIVGEYNTFSNILNDEFNSYSFKSKNFFLNLENILVKHKKEKEFLLIVVDEFGKVLEHAAKNDPESELYFIQQFAEFLSNPKFDNVMLITTLHQNFGSYSRNLTKQQRNEWEKVKGRYKEIVFSEPIEQLLHLAAIQIEKSSENKIFNNFDELFDLAIKTNFIKSSFDKNVAEKLYPLDIFAAVILTYAIQRYGQNERSLFTFLNSKDENSISNFKSNDNLTYNLANVHDYIIYNFHSYLSEVNTDSTNWRAIRVALERAEALLDIKEIGDASKIIKTIGLCNMFSKYITFDETALSVYSLKALEISNPQKIIDKLIQFKIIRYAKYKKQYILFEGTDINIEDELLKASKIVPHPINIVDGLRPYFDFKIVQANYYYYSIGTPRFFKFILSDEPITTVPTNEIDGYINLVFSNNNKIKYNIIEESKNNDNAIIYVYYKNSNKIVEHLREIRKLEYLLKKIADERDIVAEKEIKNLIFYEKELLNKDINQSLTSFSQDIEWYYNGKEQKIDSQVSFNKLLSKACFDVYCYTPKMHNELFNKAKLNIAISSARTKLLLSLIDNNNVALEDLGMEKDKFPPEKTIYYSLLKNTGIHRKVNGTYLLGEPKDESFTELWNACGDFMKSAVVSKRKIGDLISILKAPPFKLKQGFIDFWIPIYLIIKQQDYSLYNSNDTYIPNINKDVLDLLKKSPNNFKIKSFAVEGIKVQYFNEYRNFINLNDKELITHNSFLETIKPFFVFYNSLDEFAKHTTNFDYPYTAKFRDVLANATDPEKTFFEDLPSVFGFDNETLTNEKESLSKYQEGLQNAVRELRNSYQKLLNNIESFVLEVLGLESINYIEYKKEIEERFMNVKPYLLSNKQKNFLNRLLSPEQNKKIWYESICYVVLDKPLSQIKDDEVENLMETLRHLFIVLTKFVDISKISESNKDSEIYNFEIVSTQGIVKPQSFILNKNKKEKTKMLEKKINNVLSGDDNLDICTLLRILKLKVNNG